MFLFPVFSLVTFFFFVTVLSTIKLDFSEPYLLGLLLDIPSIVTILIAYFVRSTPLAVFLTFLSVLGFGQILGTLSSNANFYTQTLFINQSFLCVILSRLLFRLSRKDISSMVGTTFFNRKLASNLIQWKWTDRANKLVNKIAKFMDILIVLILPFVWFNTDVAMIATVIIWLFFFAFIASPILLAERGAKVFISLKKSGELSQYSESGKTSLKDNLEKSKQSLERKTKSIKQWVRDGFNE